MAAKEVMLFIPERIGSESIFHRLVLQLGLEMEVWPDGVGIVNRISAKRGGGKSLLMLEYVRDGHDVIHELSEWENPSRAYKDLILACKAYIAMHYRDIEVARSVMLALAPCLSEGADECIVENGDGCLLVFSSILACLAENKAWSWERTEFPDLPGVAPSEWKDVGE